MRGDGEIGEIGICDEKFTKKPVILKKETLRIK